jgi:hypothetical protein
MPRWCDGRRSKGTADASTARLARVLLVACALTGFARAEEARAQEYPIQVNATLNGLNIGIDPVFAGSLVVVKLTNKGDKAARCEFEFINGPQIPFRRTTRIEPAATESIPFSLIREVTSVMINAVCTPTSD